jgi:hypothetical protein
MFQIADSNHLRKLEKAIEHIGDVRLILFDPITSYLSGINANSNSEVRSALGGLVRLAQRHNVCILGISHLNKKADLDAMYRSLGSMGFVAQARSVWGVVKDKSDDTGETKIFSPIKSNLSIKVRGLSYQIEDARLAWGTEPIEESIDQSLRDSPALDSAVEFLQDILSDDAQILQQELVSQANNQGIKTRTLYRAYEKLRIKSVMLTDKEGRKHKYWYMKDSNSE